MPNKSTFLEYCVRAVLLPTICLISRGHHTLHLLDADVNVQVVSDKLEKVLLCLPANFSDVKFNFHKMSLFGTIESQGEWVLIRIISTSVF